MSRIPYCSNQKIFSVVISGGMDMSPLSPFPMPLRVCSSLSSVPERILFKVAVLTYHAVNGSAPEYLSSYFTRVANVPSCGAILQSHYRRQAGLPSLRRNLWNSLPANLTSAPSLTIFRQRLKTHLFRRSYPDLII